MGHGHRIHQPLEKVASRVRIDNRIHAGGSGHCRSLNDELCLKDSNIQDNAELLAKLRYSVVALNPCARRFLKLSAEEAKLLDSFAEDLKKECGEADRKMARPNLKLVRRTINEYRDDRYDRFVNLRNGTWSTMVFTGMTAFCLLAIAMIVAAPVHTVVAGMVFYLVGATVGLWGHLHNESKASGEISDYGLSTARLYSTPLYSGLVAVGGVVLTAVLPYAGDIFQPEPVARSSRVTSRASTNAPAATSITNGVVIRNIASAISNTTPATEEHGTPKRPRVAPARTGRIRPHWRPSSISKET